MDGFEKLNIGGGSVDLPGFFNIDRKNGWEAFPLRRSHERGVSPIPDDSVEEIRASHVLEHFSFADAMEALKEWHRVLKPGGRIRVAVPDPEKAMQLRAAGDDKWRFYLMGGQTEADNFHRSVFDESLLSAYLEEAGFEDVRRWPGDSDTSTHPVSLNLEANKPDPTPYEIKIATVLSRPRFGLNDFWDCAMTELGALGLPLGSHKGVFWGQCMQRSFESAVEGGCDWILTLDYDTLFTRQHIRTLMRWLKRRPDIDAIAALQCRRGKPFPLMTVMEMGDPANAGKTTAQTWDGTPMLATTAHFGLTILRVESLKKLPKPWFISKPDKDGCWGEGRMDDDIYFWHQWRLAGNTLYVAPDARIGHEEEMVAVFDENMQPTHMYPSEWREANGMGKKGGK